AIPLAAQQLGFQLMGTVDAVLLGHYEKTSLAAAGLGNNLLFALTSIGMGIVMGLDTVVPQAIGGRRTLEARRLLDAGLRLAIGVGLAASLLVLAAPLVLRLTAVPAEVVEQTWIYIAVRAFGVVPFLLSIALRSYLAAHNVTRPLIIAVVIGNIANAGLSSVLIFGLGPVPSLGIIGAAIGTVVVQVAIVAIYFAAVRALDPTPRPRGTREDVVAIVKYGGPVGGQMFAEVGIFGVSTVLAAHLGTVSAASHSVALNLGSFTFAVAVGIGASTSVRVGHAIGAGDRALARQRGKAGLLIGLVTMAAFALVFVTLPRPIASLFTDEHDVIAATVPLLYIAALFQLSDGAQAVAAGALRGLGDTRSTLYGNLFGHYGVGLAISIALAFGAGMGTPGLWWGLSAGLTATGLYLVAKFFAGTRPLDAAS
ncbi:MAG: MATE family efflux transporter, partial [Kofleriaceae bacterium]